MFYVQMLSLIINYFTQKTPASVQRTSGERAESGNTKPFQILQTCFQISISKQLHHQVQQPVALGTAHAIQQVFLNKMAVNMTRGLKLGLVIMLLE